jgi:hypothetical protein
MASLHKPLSNQRWNLSPRVAGLHIGYEKSGALIVGRIQPEHPCSLAPRARYIIFTGKGLTNFSSSSSIRPPRISIEAYDFG